MTENNCRACGVDMDAHNEKAVQQCYLKLYPQDKHTFKKNDSWYMWLFLGMMGVLGILMLWGVLSL